MDTILALSFVKENIEHFGGDSNRMTIFGQSSGAAMVSALIISPKVQENSLFQRAIVQSGSVLANWAYSMDPINDSRDIAAVAGLNRNQSLASLNRAFMTMDVVDLLTAVDRYHVCRVSLRSKNEDKLNFEFMLPIFSLDGWCKEWRNEDRCKVIKCWRSKQPVATIACKTNSGFREMQQEHSIDCRYHKRRWKLYCYR